MKPQDPSTSFAAKHEEISRAALGIQSAFRRLIQSILPHEPSGRSLARAFGLDKTLGWQVHRVATATDAATVLAALPGRRGVAIFLEAVGARAADPALVDEARRSVEALAAAAERLGVHPREMRAIAAGGLDTAARRRQLERMLAIHHDSAVAIRGEVASTAADAWFVAPSKADPSLATLGALHFIAGLRTLRPLGPRAVYRGASTFRSLEDWERQRQSPADALRVPWIVPEASSPRLDLGGIEMRHTPNGCLVVADPDRHPDKALTLGFAELIEGIGSLYRTGTDTIGEVSSQLAMPKRHFSLDVLFHRSLPEVEPNPAMYFGASLGAEHGEHRELRRFAGEVEGKFVRSPRVPGLSAPDSARHAHLLAYGARMVGFPLEEFRVFRMRMAHPPAMTRAVVRWLLPDPPAR